MLQAMFNMGKRQNNFEQLNKLIESVWKQPSVNFIFIQMLNDSFRIYCNKVASKKDHNIDLPFLVGFYDDMYGNITEFPDGFLSIYVKLALI